MEDDVIPLLEEVPVGRLGGWKVTNNLAYAIEVEVVTANGTRVISTLPIGASVLLIPAVKEDASMIARRVAEESGLRLVRVDTAGEGNGAA